MTKIVNIKEGATFDIYIGRGLCPKTNKISKWGNPFTPIKHKKTLAKEVVKTTKEALEKYENYILSTPELYEALDELKDKDLGCFCRDQSKCHGGVLIKLLNNKYKNISLF